VESATLPITIEGCGQIVEGSGHFSIDDLPEKVMELMEDYIRDSGRDA